MRKLLLLILIMALAATAAAADFNIAVSKTTLDNGLTVLISEDHTVPTVSVQTFVNAGSRDEDKPGVTGLAHVFEHMMFHGTKKYPSYTDAVAKLGAENNAYTNDDYTCYFINADARFLDQMLDIESDRIRNLDFTQEAFRTELGPVKEERRHGVEDDPNGYLDIELYEEAYRKHTYQHPVIGWEEDLEVNMTYQDGLDFKNHFYVPNNCYLVIVGNINQQDVLQLVNKYYASWPKAEPYVAKITPEPQQTEERIKNFIWKDDQISPLLLIGYHIPSIKSDLQSVAALEMIQQILFSGSGRLTRLLRNKMSLVESLRGDVNVRKDPGLFVVSARLRRGVELERVADSVYSQIALLTTQPVSTADMKRAVNNLRAQMVYRLDRPARVAGSIGFYQVIGGDYDMMTKLYDMYGQVTPEEIMAIAKQVFDQFNRTVVTLMPKKVS